MNRFAYLVISIFAVFALGFAISMPRALAGDTSTSNDSSASCMNNGVRPSPYTGGAGVARVFYPADGSTVTVTTTGAVIKQSPCGTPYREGWVNVSNICNINSAGDLTGNLSAGGTSPYTNNSGSNRTYDYSCGASNPSSSNNTNTSNSSSNSSATASSSATAAATSNTYVTAERQNVTYSNTPVTKAASTTNNSNTNTGTTYNNGAYNNGKGVLPNTGPGDALALGGISTFAGTIGHFLYSKRRRA